MNRFRALLTLILSLAFAIAPALSDPFSGFREDQLPIPQIDPPVQPAGYAFAIWGLIYAWLVVSAIYGVWKRSDDRDWDRARLPLIISLAVGTPWLAVANASALWATFLIFVMAEGAIAALLRAPRNDIWWFRVPVGIYAGWLTAAAFVSLGSTAAGYDFLTGPVGWAYICISGALVVTTLVLRRASAPAYGLTVTWALIAIVLANGTARIDISILAALGTVMIAILTRAAWLNARRSS